MKIGVWAAASVPLAIMPFGLPKDKPSTMMAHVFSFMIPLKGLQMVLSEQSSSSSQQKALEKKGDEEVKQEFAQAETLIKARGKQQQQNPTFQEIVRSFVYWQGSFLWYMFPIRPVSPEDRRPLPEVMKYSVLCFASSFGKSVLQIFLHKLLMELSSDRNVIQVAGGSLFNRPRYVLSLLWGLWVLFPDPMNDILCGVVPLITNDRYRILPFSNFPLFSQSLREFWGRRYNQLIRTLYHETIFVPLVKNNVDVSTASAFVFFMSGVFHAYIANGTFGKGIGSTTVFFCLHGGAVMLESHLRKKEKENEKKDLEKTKKGSSPFSVGKWALTQTFLGLTLPLYLGLFVGALPTFIEERPLQKDNLLNQVGNGLW
eukprot:CAMPEP_0201478358 /NCGR_PEP_ID=MMETSP0151_2-20130828/3225_1 /ASSEMBLY_ACC=CAM_ASM_000257 /TAXON_ID=200890 /ORGANISM="Paramoeba atlantica, Strain 621/1 / CCAP 1560/9" /LENGTH=371 /DNA_ID=CAMNT_0047859415 /DNA_START=245 /DNA_END=1357 /DNA_ORIENTATION=-